MAFDMKVESDIRESISDYDLKVYFLYFSLFSMPLKGLKNDLPFICLHLKVVEK